MAIAPLLAPLLAPPLITEWECGRRISDSLCDNLASPRYMASNRSGRTCRGRTNSGWNAKQWNVSSSLLRQKELCWQKLMYVCMYLCIYVCMYSRYVRIYVNVWTYFLYVQRAIFKKLANICAMYVCMYVRTVRSNSYLVAVVWCITKKKCDIVSHTCPHEGWWCSSKEKRFQ